MEAIVGARSFVEQGSVFCSTVIPTIGRPQLHRAVNSVLKQQFSAADFEIIVVNDSGKLLPQAPWQQDEKVKIVNTYQRERSVARNAGAASAKGSYIHFLDDDDWMLPGAFENLWQLSQRAPDAAWLYGGCQLVDRQERPLIKYLPILSGNIFTQVMAGEWIPCLASLIKSDAFFAVGGFHPNIIAGEDNDLCRRIAVIGDFAQMSCLVAVACMGTEGSSTDFSRQRVNNRFGREEILQMPGVYKRMRNSASSSYWHGRIIRVYLTSAVWNIQNRR